MEEMGEEGNRMSFWSKRPLVPLGDTRQRLKEEFDES